MRTQMLLTTSLLLCVAVPAVAAPFQAKRVSHSYVQRLSAGPAAVFPLLGPIAEARWAEGWTPEMVYPREGPAGEGAVFLTRHGGAEQLWVLTLWDSENHRVDYVHVTVDSDVTQIQIRLDGPSGGPTRAEVTYTWTGLSEKGNAFVEGHTRERHEQEMRLWEAALNHYLTTGRLLTHHGR